MKVKKREDLNKKIQQIKVKWLTYAEYNALLS